MKSGSCWGVNISNRQHHEVICRERDMLYCITLIAPCLCPRCPVRKVTISLKHPFFMLVRNWMLDDFILMRISMRRRYCNNRRWFMWFIRLIFFVDEIKHLIEIETNTKVSKRIHEMFVVQSFGILEQGLKCDFAVSYVNNLYVKKSKLTIDTKMVEIE